MHVGTLLKDLLIPMILFFTNSKCKSDKLKYRLLTVYQEDIIETINNSGIQYTLSPIDNSCINFDGLASEYYNRSGANKFEIGCLEDRMNILRLYLPTSADSKELRIRAYASYMFTNSIRIGKYIRLYGSINGLEMHFTNTAEYCEHLLCPKDSHKTITVVAYELLVAYLKHFEEKATNEVLIIGKNDYLVLRGISVPKITPQDSIDRFNSNEIIDKLANNKSIKSLVIDDKKIKEGELSFSVFIPNQMSIYDFVFECAKKVKSGNINEFLKVVIENCELNQNPKNQNVLWYKMMREIKKYSFNTTTFERQLQNGAVELNLNELDGTLCLEIFKSLVVQITDIIPFNTTSSPVESILILIDEELKNIPSLVQDLNLNLVEFFITIITRINRKEVKQIHNLSTVDRIKLQSIQIRENNFNELVKKELPINLVVPLFLKHFDEIACEDGVIATKEGDLIKFLQFPYLEEDNFDVKLLLKDYVQFIKGLIDSRCDFDGVLEELKEKLWNEKIMEAYSKYLLTKSIKSKVNTEIDSKLSNKNDEESTKEYWSIFWIIFSFFIFIILVISFFVYYKWFSSKRDKDKN